MGQALYRKYRSKSLSEVIGQEHITAALEHALGAGTISHAYLLTGPRGVGKTSIARILAYAVNGLPYDESAAHLDIIEIDAASNRRIDEIRDLRDKVHITPAAAKYKVYIIDEVHMLTREAMSALLKTLEEPPTHVIFILATTEAHKLPETIISRTQRFTFRPIDRQKVAQHLRQIAKAEKIDISDEALELISRHGEGSFRDSIGLLDQVRNMDGRVEASDVLAMLGQASPELIAELEQAVATGEAAAIIDKLQSLQNQGFEPAGTAKQLGQSLRQQLANSEPRLPDQALELLGRLIEVPASLEPAIALEIAILKTIKAPARPPTVQATSVSQDSPGADISSASPSAAEKPEAVPPPAPKKSASTQIKAKSAPIAIDENLWPQALDIIKQKHNTLYGVARMAHASWSGDKLVLECKFGFHQKTISSAGNLQIFIDTIRELTGQTVTISCVLNESLPDKVESAEESRDIGQAQPDKPADSETINTISNIFGAAELLES